MGLIKHFNDPLAYLMTFEKALEMNPFQEHPAHLSGCVCSLEAASSSTDGGGQCWAPPHPIAPSLLCHLWGALTGFPVLQPCSSSFGYQCVRSSSAAALWEDVPCLAESRSSEETLMGGSWWRRNLLQCWLVLNPLEYRGMGESP